MRWLTPRTRGNPIVLVVSEEEIEFLIYATHVASEAQKPDLQAALPFKKLRAEFRTVRDKLPNAP